MACASNKATEKASETERKKKRIVRVLCAQGERDSKSEFLRIVCCWLLLLQLSVCNDFAGETLEKAKGEHAAGGRLHTNAHTHAHAHTHKAQDKHTHKHARMHTQTHTYTHTMRASERERERESEQTSERKRENFVAAFVRLHSPANDRICKHK